MSATLRVEAVRIGVMGLGGIARHFAAVASGMPEAALAGAAAREASRAEAFAALYGCRAYPSYDALLSDSRIEAVYIATVNAMHARMVEAALRADKHVLCEKPLALAPEDAARLFELAAARGRVLLEALPTRFLPSYRAMLRWVADGALGLPLLSEAAFCYALTDHSPRHHERALGGGALYDAGVYGIAFAQGVHGAEPLDVRAALLYGPTGVDETAAVTLIYSCGLSLLRCSMRSASARDASVAGPLGRIIMPSFLKGHEAIWVDASGAELRRFTDDGEDAFVHEIRHFCAMIREERFVSECLSPSESIAIARTLAQCRAGE